LGTYAGGAWATRYAAHNERLQLKTMAVALACFGIISSLIYLSSNLYLAFALTGLAAMGGSMINGPLFAIVQTLVPQRMRAMSISLVYLFGNLVGMGLGPLAAGALSDRFRSWAGEESLRYALLVLCPGYLWAAWHLWRGSRTVRRDVDSASMDGEDLVPVQKAIRRPGAAMT
jgi:MFS family permease